MVKINIEYTYPGAPEFYKRNPQTPQQKTKEWFDSNGKLKVFSYQKAREFFETNPEVKTVEGVVIEESREVVFESKDKIPVDIFLKLMESMASGGQAANHALKKKSLIFLIPK